MAGNQGPVDPSSASSEGPFPIVDVTGWLETGDEPMGSAVKRWLEPPRGSVFADTAPTWLFKEVRAKQVHGQWRVFGEDWSEKIVAELARLLDVPTTTLELAATSAGARGVVTPTFVRAHDQRFTPGNELLAGHNPSYPVAETGQVPGYTLETVREVLEPYSPPEGLPTEIRNGFAAFAGYLVLDALVANTDRHHENWGVIETAGERARLAPSYDHGTSLGFQEPEGRKSTLLEDPKALRRWAGKGQSRHFEGKPTLVDLAADALQGVPAPAASYWRSRVETLDSSMCERILDRVPRERMSQVDRMFAAALLRVNQERLLDAC